MSSSSVGGYEQAFRLPIELDIRILSFVQLNDYESNKIILATLLSYSSTCYRFRSLVLPRLFARFRTTRNFKQIGLKDFCRAWVSGDERAKQCIQHIKTCFFAHENSDSPKSIVDKSWSSLTALSNITFLDIFYAPIDLAALSKVLIATRIEKLRLSGQVAPRDWRWQDFNNKGFNESFGDAVCRIISACSTTLKSLKFMGDCWVNVKTLSQGKFRLEEFSVQGYHMAPIDVPTLRPFLSATSSITTLELNDKTCDPGSLSRLAPTDLPHLHTLACHISCVPIFVAGSRPINSLQLEFELDSLKVTPADIVAFVDALSRSAGAIRQLKGLPPLVALSEWGIYTPLLEVISVTVPEEDDLMLDPFAPLGMQQKIARLSDNIGGKTGGSGDENFQWKNLSEFTVLLLQRSDIAFAPGEGTKDYFTNLQRQKADVLSLEARFPSLLFVELGFYTRWTRPVDAPTEWKFKVTKRGKFAFEKMVRKKYARSGTTWRRWDSDGVLAKILKG